VKEPGFGEATMSNNYYLTLTDNLNYNIVMYKQLCITTASK